MPPLGVISHTSYVCRAEAELGRAWDSNVRSYSARLLEEQQTTILEGWGMAADAIATCSRAMAYADLRGIDTHGIAMLPTYDAWRREGRLDPRAAVTVVQDDGALALVDGGHGLGHVAAEHAMTLAVAKAGTLGMGGVAVRRSTHFGAAGCYALIAADAGMIGMVFAGTPGRAVVPPRGREPRFGAVPFAFAAPSASGEPLLVDIAMSTVAMGKINLARLAGAPIPEGWAVDLEGRPLTDAAEAFRLKRLTPMAGHKGYALGVMVEVMASLIAGAFVGGHDLHTGERGERLEIGHFVLAVDAGRLGAAADGSRLADRVDALGGLLRSTMPVDPAAPVLAPGDPERAMLAERLANGIPLLPALVEDLRAVAANASVPFLL